MRPDIQYFVWFFRLLSSSSLLLVLTFQPSSSMASVILDIFKVIFFKNNLIWPVQLLVSRFCSFPWPNTRFYVSNSSCDASWIDRSEKQWHYLNKVKLEAAVEGDLKAPLLIATTLRCAGATLFQGLTHFTLDPHLIMPSVKQGSIKYHFFWVFGMTRPWIEPRSPGPLANTLTIMPMSGLSFIFLERLVWSTVKL